MKKRKTKNCQFELNVLASHMSVHNNIQEEAQNMQQHFKTEQKRSGMIIAIKITT